MIYQILLTKEQQSQDGHEDIVIDVGVRIDRLRQARMEQFLPPALYKQRDKDGTLDGVKY